MSTLLTIRLLKDSGRTWPDAEIGNILKTPSLHFRQGLSPNRHMKYIQSS
jgi:hypothetical protein